MNRHFRNAGGSIEPFAVDDEMTIVANLNLFVTHGDHALNVELVIAQAVYAFGFEHNDFTAFGVAEIIGEAVHKQMVAAGDLYFIEGFAGFEDSGIGLAVIVYEASAFEEAIRGKPNGIVFTTDSKSLL